MGTMNEARYQELIETSWRRKLAEPELRELERFLQAEPGALQQWKSEEALNQALRSLPDAPVPSNFASLVQNAVTSGTRRRRQGLAGFLPGWIPARFWPRLGTGLAAAALCAAGVYGYRLHARVQMARSVAAVSTIAAIPKIEWLENFDAIHELGRSPQVDEDLLALLR